MMKDSFEKLWDDSKLWGRMVIVLFVPLIVGMVAWIGFLEWMSEGYNE